VELYDEAKGVSYFGRSPLVPPASMPATKPALLDILGVAEAEWLSMIVNYFSLYGLYLKFTKYIFGHRHVNDD
jgi:hypothetical protein